MGINWNSATVGDAFELVNGFAFKSKDFLETGVPVIKIKNVKAGYFSEHEFSYVDPVFLDSRKDKVARFDDLLISMSGNRHDGSPETWVGKVALFRKESPYLINQRVGALRVKDLTSFDPRFMSYLLASWMYQSMFIAVATSSGGQANLSPGQILSAPIDFPDVDTQKAIAHILGTLDDKIELNRQMNATLEAMAQALFKSWFVDFDPVIDNALAAGNPIPEPLQARAEARAALGDHRKPLPEAIQKQFPSSFVCSEEMGWVPAGWQVQTLNAVTTALRRGLAPKYTETNGVQVINQKCIRDHSVNYELTRRNDPSKRKIEGYEIRVGDVLVNSTGVGTLGRMAQVFNLDETTVVDTHVTVVRPDTKTYQPFVFGQLMLSIEPTVEAMGEGTTGQTELSRSNLQALKVLVPHMGSQECLEKRLAAFAERRVATSKENSNLAKLRDTLLPKLLSGQLRIPEAEKQLSEAP